MSDDEVIWAQSMTGDDFQCVHVDAWNEAKAEIAKLKDLLSEWRPIETHPKTPYEEVLLLVNTHDDEGLTHRIGMWDPENDDWTVFMANWDPEPVYWMPLPPPPDEAREWLNAPPVGREII